MLIYAQKVCKIPDWYKQEFSDFFAGAPLYEIQQFQCTTNILVYVIKKAETETT